MILICGNNDNKYNPLIDKTVYTLNYFLTQLFPSKIKANDANNDINKGIEEIINIMPKEIDMDRIERISWFNNVINGLIHLLNGLILKQVKRTKTRKSRNKNLKLPLKNMFVFIIMLCRFQFMIY